MQSGTFLANSFNDVTYRSLNELSFENRYLPSFLDGKGKSRIYIQLASPIARVQGRLIV